MAGDPGTLQDRLDRAGSDGIGLPIDFQEQVGVFHGVCDDLRPSLMLVQLEIEIPHRSILLKRLEHDASGGRHHPPAVVLAFLQEIQKLAWITEGTTVVVRVDVSFRHCLLPPFKMISQTRRSGIWTKKEHFDLWRHKSKRK